jgi:hypothetical protein
MKQAKVLAHALLIMKSTKPIMIEYLVTKRNSKMPVHKVMKNGKVGYQWGQSGTVYTGPGAQAKATRQGQAAHAAGYKQPEPKRK